MDMSNYLLLRVVQFRVKSEEFEQVMRVRPIDIYLIEQKVLSVLSLTSELLDLIVISRLLRSKLIAREGQDF